MLGLLIAAMMSLVLFTMGNTGGVIFKKASAFLFKWYLIAASLVTIFSVVVILTGSLTLGFLTAGPLGALVGSFAGGALALMSVFYVAVAYVLQICGSKILHSSLQVNADGTNCWDTVKLSIGIAMVLFGVGIFPILS